MFPPVEFSFFGFNSPNLNITAKHFVFLLYSLFLIQFFWILQTFPPLVVLVRVQRKHPTRLIQLLPTKSLRLDFVRICILCQLIMAFMRWGISSRTLAVSYNFVVQLTE